MKKSLLLDFSLIFDGEKPLQLNEYFKEISKNKLKIVASHFLGIDLRTSDLNDWRELLKMWFRQENIEFRNQVWKRCELLEQQYGSLTFITPPAFLYFFEFIKDFPEDNEKVDEATSEKNLFIVYLIFISKTTDKERVSENYIEALPENRKLAGLLINQQFAYGEYYNYQLGDVFQAQLIKACYLFIFLENHDSCSYLLKTFCKFYSLKSWREFFQFLIPIIQAHSLHPKNGGWTQITVTKDENFDRNCFFLDSLSEKGDNEADFQSIRSNPLYKAGDGIYGIIFPLFVIEKIFKGSYFKIKELNDAIDSAHSDKIDWTRVYKKEFSESTLLYNVLRYIYSKRSYIQLCGDALKPLDEIGPPDYYMRNGNDIYVFENKDIYINSTLRQAFDFEKLEQALREKLYYNTEEKARGKIRIKPKAVKQLGRNIKKILLKENKYDKNYQSERIRIFPILVLHDASFECAGLNTYINSWFQIEMKSLKDIGINVSNVRQITVINIDTLILYADIFRDKKQTLNGIIDAYIKHCTFNLNKQKITMKQYEEAVTKTFEPFSVFIDNYTKVQHTQVTNMLGKSMMNKIFESEVVH